MSVDDATEAESPPRGVDSYYRPGNFEDPSPIVYPTAANGVVSNFKIQPNCIAILPVFRGHAEPYAHLREFFSIADTYQVNNTTKDGVRLRLYPFSLKDQAKAWFTSLEPGSIHSWRAVSRSFSRLKELLRTCPHHDVPKWEIVKVIHDGLDYHNQQFVMATSGGKKDDNVKSDSKLVNDLLKDFPKPPTQNPKANESPKVGEGGVSSTTTPYPEALEKPASSRLAKKGPHSEDMWETFKQGKINLPLIDAIKQIPTYAKFLKDLCTQKRKLKATLPKKIDLTKHVSAVLSSSLPSKFKDLGAPLISVVVGNITIKKALLDLSASINILPAMMEKTPSLNPLKNIHSLTKQEDDHDQPLSPMSRLFHESGANVYNIAIIGMKTSIDVDVFKAELQAHMMTKNHRFSSLQVQKKNGSMAWVPTQPNIDNHIVVPKLDPDMEASDKFVEDYISNLSRSRIDYSIPLWDVHILNTKTSYAQGTCFFRFHHSLGDGLSLINLLLACSRKVSDPEALPTVPGNKVSSHHVKVTSFRSLFVVLWNTIVGLVTLMSTALFLKDTDTPLKRSPVIENRTRRFVLRSVSLADIKMIKSAMNVTVNDVIVGVVQCALYRYLNRRYGGGENISRVPENIRLRANIAFNLRPSTHVDISGDTARQERWGNKAACVLLPFSIKPMKDPLDYVRDVKTIMERKKASFEAVCIFFIIKLSIKLLGVKLAAKILQKVEARTTLWFSNIPGPQEEVAFCGHEIVYLAPSSYGQTAALMITAVSYVDKVTFAVSVDDEIVRDPQNLCDDLQESLHLIKTAVLAGEGMYVHGYTNDEYEPDPYITLISKCDVSNPLHLHPNDSAALTIVSVKLQGTENYQVWSYAMLLALEGKNKTGFIDGSCRRPNTEDVLRRLSSILSRETLPDVRISYAIISSEESYRVASGSIFGTSQRSPLLMDVHKVARDSQLMVVFDEINCYVLNQEFRTGKILGIGKQIGGLYYFHGNKIYQVMKREGFPTLKGMALLLFTQVVLLALLNEDDGGHSHDTNASSSEGERSANLEDNIISSEGDDLHIYPHEGLSQSDNNVQNLRRSSRPFIFPRNFNNFMVDSKVKYGLGKYVNYSNLSKGNYCFATLLNKGTEPKTFFKASRHKHWVDTMNAEMDALYRKNTWELVDLPAGRKSIGSKWVFKIKYMSDGVIE
nr:O-acyltransferase WSD1-like [Tanacetum cinerariifolium]